MNSFDHRRRPSAPEERVSIQLENLLDLKEDHQGERKV